MTEANFEEELNKRIPGISLLRDEPMAKHTTFRVGGPAQYLVQPDSTGQLQEVLRVAQETECPIHILGNGSNLLVSDSGVNGLVILLGSRFSRITVEGNTICAQAGAFLSQVAAKALEHGLTGFEFAAGIPGSVGGGIVMNAGAYGGELKQVVKQVTLLNADGELETLSCEQMQFGYRDSLLKHREGIVVEAQFTLLPGDKETIRKTMDELAAKRRQKQPLEYPSAGSTFKRPEGHFAGALIQEAGFAGFRLGDAMISEKHCGFLVNAGEATAEQIQSLIALVQSTVLEKSGVSLEPEVIFWGE